MHKDELRNNRSSAKNIGLLHGKLHNNRVLVISTPITIPTGIKLRNYFDIIIADGLGASTCVENPDILIYSSDTFYEQHVYNETALNNLQETLCCINIQVLEEAVKVRKNFDAHILSFMPVEDNVLTYEPKTIHSVNFGLCANYAGLHIAKLGGATDVYNTNIGDYGTYLDNETLNSFIYQKGIYGIPKNLRSSNRKNLIDNIIW